MDLDYYLNYTKANENINAPDQIANLSKKYNEQYNSAITPFYVVIDTDRADEVYIDFDKNKTTKCLFDFGKQSTKGDSIPYLIKEVKFYPEVIKNGTYFTLYDKIRNKEKTYLVLGKYEHREGYDISYSALCDYKELKFYNKNIQLINIPCLAVNTTFYSSGIEQTKDSKITLPKGKLNILIKDNDDTSALQRDIRIIVDGMAWRITNTNRLKGYLDIVCEEDVFSNLDDQENQIANRWKYENKHEYKIETIPNVVNLEIGRDRKLETKVYDNGIEITNPLLTYRSDDHYICLVSHEVVHSVAIGSTNIYVDYIGEDGSTYTNKIPVNIVQNVSDNINYSLSSSNQEGFIIKYASVVTFTPHKTNNNVEVPTEWSFEVDFRGLPQYLVNTVEVNEDYIKIKNYRVNTEKQITLKYREVGKTNWIEQNITLKGLF